MADIGLPPGFSARPPVPADAEAVARALSASRVADGDVATDADDVRDDWAEVDLENDVVVVCNDRGRIVAGADVLNRGFVRISVYGYVDPAWRGRGIGRALVGWGEEWIRARAHLSPDGSRVLVDHFVPSAARDARRLLDCMEYIAVRATLIMRADLEARPEARRPAGTTVRTYVPGPDDLVLFETGEAAFADSWGRPRGSLERWIAPTKAPGFDPGLWFLAEDAESEQTLGLCLAQMTQGEGWIRSLGVRPEARRKGVGLALLLTAFQAAFDRGARVVELSVDAESPTNAPMVYERAGMRPVRTFLLYQKELRPGTDLFTYR